MTEMYIKQPERVSSFQTILFHVNESYAVCIILTNAYLMHQGGSLTHHTCTT